MTRWARFKNKQEHEATSWQDLKTKQRPSNLYSFICPLFVVWFISYFLDIIIIVIIIVKIY